MITENKKLQEIICKTGQDLFKIKVAIYKIFENFECFKFDEELKNIVDSFKKDIEEIRK